MTELVLPAYRDHALSDVLASVGQRLDIPGCRADVLDLPAGEHWVVLLVDGLGRNGLDSAPAAAPYLTAHRSESAPITVGVPSSTTTSLTSLGTGLPPGMHGIAGYRFRDSATDKIFSPLTWNTTTPADEFQPMTTIFERARAEGIAVTSVIPARFEQGGLTTAALRGAKLSPVLNEKDDEDRIARTVAGAAAGPRTLVYVYERMLDHAGHLHGAGSPEWLEQLSKVDTFVEKLRAALPDVTRLLVTGDHGMVNVGADRRIAMEDEAELMAGITLIGGEGRFRQVYTDEPAAVAQRWRDRLDDRAWVRTRDEAADEGWFGKLAPRVADRFGDVVAAMRDDWALLTVEAPGEFDLIGMHGSLTEDEMVVPLYVL